MKRVTLASPRSPLPDRVPPETVPLGSVTSELAARDIELAAKDARIRALELDLALAEQVLISQRSQRGDADDVLERIQRTLAPRETR